MHRMILALCCSCLVFALGTAYAQTPGMLISEYIDGTGENNAIEIFNGSASSVDLTFYFLRIRFHNHPTLTMLTHQFAPNTTLPPGGTFTIVDSDADPALLAHADGATASLDIDGDDAITLAFWNGSSYVTVDSFGQWNVDPGSAWTCAAGSTQLVTLRRNFDVCTGDTDETDAFTPCGQWDFYPVDTYEGLGTHSTICNSGVPVEHRRWTQLKAAYR